MKSRSCLWLLVFAVALVATGCKETEPGLSQFTVVTAGQHRLAVGDALPGNVVVLRGEMDVLEGARVDGALLIVSGNSVVTGTVDGDIWLINGTLTLAPGAQVGGSVSVVGGELERDAGATIRGPVRTGQEVQLLGPAPAVSLAERIRRGLAGTLLLALLAYTFVRLLPRPLMRVAQATLDQPAVAGAIGALTGIVFPAAILLMGLTILLIPVCLAAVLAFIGLVTYGWVGLALAVGRLAPASFRYERSPALMAAIGMVMLMLFTILAGLIPLLGRVVIAVELSVALGAALLTLAGTRAYTPTSNRS